MLLPAYVVLLLVTTMLCKRPLTTELFLIVGWAMLALEEVNALYGMGRFSHQPTLVFIAVIIAAFIISMASYVLYTRLDTRASYIDGFMPLLLAALVTAGLSLRMMRA